MVSLWILFSILDAHTKFSARPIARSLSAPNATTENIFLFCFTENEEKKYPGIAAPCGKQSDADRKMLSQSCKAHQEKYKNSKNLTVFKNPISVESVCKQILSTAQKKKIDITQSIFLIDGHGGILDKKYRVGTEACLWFDLGEVYQCLMRSFEKPKPIGVWFVQACHSGAFFEFLEEKGIPVEGFAGCPTDTKLFFGSFSEDPKHLESQALISFHHNLMSSKLGARWTSDKIRDYLCKNGKLLSWENYTYSKQILMESKEGALLQAQKWANAQKIKAKAMGVECAENKFKIKVGCQLNVRLKCLQKPSMEDYVDSKFEDCYLDGKGDLDTSNSWIKGLKRTSLGSILSELGGASTVALTKGVENFEAWMSKCTSLPKYPSAEYVKAVNRSFRVEKYEADFVLGNRLGQIEYPCIRADVMPCIYGKPWSIEVR